MIRRTIDSHALHVLNDWGKTVLLSGPRQVGKTTLARDLQAQVGQGTYFNWDVVVAFETVRDWLLVLEQFYYLFRVTPWSKSVARSLKKEAKVYLYDWVEVPGDGPRFENLVAMHLHKAVLTWRALGAGDVELHYVRDKEKREVDFVLTDGGQPVCLVECKSGDETPSPALRHFQGVLGVPIAVQLVNKPGICRKTREEGRSLWVVSADRWLAMLP